MSVLASYAPALPEIILAAGAMALLMLGAFQNETSWNGETVGWLAVALLAVAGLLIWEQGGAPERLFEAAFVSDAFARFAKLLVLGGAAATLIMSFAALRRAHLMKFEVPVLVLLASIGMMMMVSANDLIALYLGLELMSLSLYVLAAINRDDVRSSEAGLKYFVLGALSSGMLLYGASLIYGFTGSTNFQAIASVAKSEGGIASAGLVVGMVFLLVGLAFKVSAVPFHMWTPDVYQGAPTPVTAFFAAAPKIAAMALLTRVVATAFPGIAGQWQQIVIFLAIGSMLLGSLAAIGQTNIKRLLAYSSIANIGFALVGLASATEEGVTSVLIYLAIYLVMTLGAFACVLAMRRGDTMVEEISDLSGLAQTNLAMAGALGALMFSLAGIPPLAGFFAKFYVFKAAIDAELYPLAVIGVLATVVGAYYYLRIVKIMFFDDPMPGFAKPDSGLGFVMGLSALIVLLYVVAPSRLLDAASAAAKSLQY